MDDPEFQLFRDVYMPSEEKTIAVYGIYDKAILHLLQGRIESIYEMDFMIDSKNRPHYDLEDTKTILSIGEVVVLETEDSQTITNYFVGGRNYDRLQHLMTLFVGLPEEREQEYKEHRLKDFLKSLKEVEKMGFFTQDD